MTIAGKPSTTIISFTKGSDSTVPGSALEGALVFTSLKMANNTKQILQMIVNREINLIAFIRRVLFKNNINFQYQEV